jgi:prepilin-type N-terminal cleavage/methylation domain-containing protein
MPRHRRVDIRRAERSFPVTCRLILSDGVTSSTFMPMPHRQMPPGRRRYRGFSLVELLIVIAVVGIMAAIVMPHVGNSTRMAIIQRDRNNAQRICSMASGASAAGADFMVPGDKEASIRKLMQGVNGGDSAMRNVRFTLSMLKPEEITSAAALIEIRDNTLGYKTKSPTP